MLFMLSLVSIFLVEILWVAEATKFVQLYEYEGNPS